MNKETLAAEIIRIYALKGRRLTTREADDVTDAVLEAMKAALARGETISIQNFGKFEAYAKKATTYNNFKTKVSVPARKSIKFKAARALTERLRNYETR